MRVECKWENDYSFHNQKQDSEFNETGGNKGMWSGCVQSIETGDKGKPLYYLLFSAVNVFTMYMSFHYLMMKGLLRDIVPG